jgi:hypothetical protein
MTIFVKFYLAIAMLNCDTLEIKVAGLALCFTMLTGGDKRSENHDAARAVYYGIPCDAGRDDPAGTLIFGAVTLVIVQL